MKNSESLLASILPGYTAEFSGNTARIAVTPETLRDAFQTAHALALPLITLFATDDRATIHAFRIHYVFGIPKHEAFYIVLTLTLEGTSFPSLARRYPNTAMYEREIMSLFGLTAEGHPDPRSIILHEENWPKNTYPLRKDFAWNTTVPETRSGTYRFNIVKGEGIYEIPVGPVHAGIIEPGHFRFSMAGEEMVALEPRLGWVHKGVEKLFENLPMEKHLTLAEHISGDSSFAHALAYSQGIETLTKTTVPDRVRFLRVIFAEMERIANHCGDIGAIMLDTGHSFGGSNGARMRERVLQMNEILTGSRFLRGVVVPGGMTKDIKGSAGEKLTNFLKDLRKDFAEVIEVADSDPTLQNRLVTTGRLSRDVAKDYGALGIAARCTGIEKDARVEYPYAAYDSFTVPIAIEQDGDVNARFHVRIREVYASIDLILEALELMPDGSIMKLMNKLPEAGMIISVVEGWRGEIAYAIVAEKGTLTRVKVRDTSFINWQLFPHIIHKDIVPDFPLINKSFNLSYTGNDL